MVLRDNACIVIVLKGKYNFKSTVSIFPYIQQPAAANLNLYVTVVNVDVCFSHTA